MENLRIKRILRYKKKKLHRPNQDVEHAVPPDFARLLVHTQAPITAGNRCRLRPSIMTRTARGRLQQRHEMGSHQMPTLWIRPNCILLPVKAFLYLNSISYFQKKSRLSLKNQRKTPSQLRRSLELVIRIELMTSSLPMTCSTD